MSRRDVLAGAGAVGLASPAQGRQPPDASASPDTESALAPEVLALLTNLTTRLAVRVSINDQGPFDFVVDTGAHRTTIARSLADALALPPGPEVIVHGVTAAQQTSTVRVDRLRVAGVRSAPIAMPVFSRERIGADGLLGLDVLGRFQLIFNMAQRRLLMSPTPALLHLQGYGQRLRGISEIAAERRVDQLVFSSERIGSTPVTAFVDSGSQYTIGNLELMRAIDSRQPGGLGPRWSVPIIGVTGQRLMGELAIVEQLRLGQTRLRRAPMVFADLHAFDYLGLSGAPALLLGADTLGRIETVVVDFVQSRVTFGRGIV